jgi:hypothetical protein
MGFTAVPSSNVIVMGKACSIHADKKCVQNLYEKLNRRDDLGDPIVDGRTVLKWTFVK